MKLSELIENLQYQLDMKGDLDVKVEGDIIDDNLDVIIVDDDSILLKSRFI